MLDQFQLVAHLLPDGLGERSHAFETVAHPLDRFQASLSPGSVYKIVYMIVNEGLAAEGDRDVPPPEVDNVSGQASCG